MSDERSRLPSSVALTVSLSFLISLHARLTPYHPSGHRVALIRLRLLRSSLRGVYDDEEME